MHGCLLSIRKRRLLQVLVCAGLLEAAKCYGKLVEVVCLLPFQSTSSNLAGQAPNLPPPLTQETELQGPDQ